MNALDRNGVQIDAVQAPDVDTPSGEVRYTLGNLSGGSETRPSEREDAAGGAKVVLSGACVPLVQREVFEEREKAKPISLDSMDERPSSSTDRAVTRSDVIEVEVDLKTDATTVARASIRFHAAQRNFDRSVYRVRFATAVCVSAGATSRRSLRIDSRFLLIPTSAPAVVGGEGPHVACRDMLHGDMPVEVGKRPYAARPLTVVRTSRCPSTSCTFRIEPREEPPDLLRPSRVDAPYRRSPSVRRLSCRTRSASRT